ncbi:hypothetical protein KAJ02_12990, partial [Candidatus Bipolaricaulota bacterium]|nr:hypothetical protein [Candidatus Bipolaricaulota bacterium]
MCLHERSRTADLAYVRLVLRGRSNVVLSDLADTGITYAFLGRNLAVKIDNSSLKREGSRELPHFIIRDLPVYQRNQTIYSIEQPIVVGGKEERR